MAKQQRSKPVIVFTGHAWEAALLQNLLENEGIRAFLNNEYFGTLFPFNKTPGKGDVRLIVSKKDEDSAKRVVKEFERGRFE
ncbi:MAG: DUF2007 domain-containing protein [Bacteroidales bacterium]|nr:DUF2007 domain-containing protein [Bacteroidales bacterium]